MSCSCGKLSCWPCLSRDVAPRPQEPPPKVYLVEKFSYEQRHEDVEQTMAVATSHASACGLALRLIDMCGGEWRWDSWRRLWEEQREDGWALRVSLPIQADTVPWRNIGLGMLIRVGSA